MARGQPFGGPVQAPVDKMPEKSRESPHESPDNRGGSDDRDECPAGPTGFQARFPHVEQSRTVIHSHWTTPKAGMSPEACDTGSLWIALWTAMHPHDSPACNCHQSSESIS
jgi:hypothetical protein